MRAFDDGVAFRYIVPEQPSIKSVHIADERTQFRYSKDATLYPLVLSGFQSSYEDDYQMRTVGGLHRDWLVALPLLAEVPGTGWVAITEANINNYAGMYLRSDKPLFSLKAELSPKVDLPGRCGGRNGSLPVALASAHDRGRSRAADRVEHHSQPESPFEDRRHLLDSRRENRPGTGGRATGRPGWILRRG